ncbi:RagB/SusD family nutrient uptake outer membrane protein [Parapedobacter sp. 2B3]|uniref:RagB/SusD family nutrient uptake outer membrane protein n=1 Tax=Parapedobacter sp. 2B3 TaxID=3342381 RepID=UPI0035B5CF9C
MKNLIKIAMITVAISGLVASCNYLDVVPDNVPTVDHAFKNRNEAEGYLYGLFSFLPEFANAASNPALLGGDEVWYIDPVEGMSPVLWYLSQGRQGTNNPLADYWSSKQDETQYGLNGGKALFTALSDCNIFLENIHKPFDLSKYEREKWIAEVKFLKAYYHFWLFRMYGPIPLIKENLEISTKGEGVQRYRKPVDEVVDYLAELLDEAAADLPVQVEDMAFEMGRPTKVIALAVKAQLLTLAASPLFNGNADYASMVDNQGIQLFPQTYNAEKWKRAADALEEVITLALEAGHNLFDFSKTPFAGNLNEKTIAAMQVRGAVTERWNSEIIWGDSNTDPDALERACHPVFTLAQLGGGIRKSYAPTLNVVEQFYTKNGVPIEEDREWQNLNLMELRKAGPDDAYYINEGFETIQLHFDREARFYGSIIFDGGTLYGNGRTTNDQNLWVTELKNGTLGGGPNPPGRYSSTGYLCKKLIHYLTAAPESSGNLSTYRYAFPIIRLADLGLMYAEALNEYAPAPTAEVYQYVDVIRERSGLPGVIESWRSHSINPDKPLTKEGMRDIIRRERLNELAFEGSRFWDLRRWKLAEEYMNRPIRGLNISGETADEFYQVRNVFSSTFEKKDYLWPIKLSVILKNKNLVQNPGW